VRQAAADDLAYALGQLGSDTFRTPGPVAVDAFERAALGEVAQDSKAAGEAVLKRL